MTVKINLTLFEHRNCGGLIVISIWENTTYDVISFEENTPLLYLNFKSRKLRIESYYIFI